MRSENGIPRPFQPNNQAQELRDLKRKVAELEARRTFVSVERIVEGGTINENVGKQITDTVQKDIVIERENLAEAALTDVVVTGSIASVGQTNENPPRELKAQLGTVQRVAGSAVPIPALVFIVGDADPALAPGIYSPDGDRLVMGAQDPAKGSGTMTVGYDGVYLLAGANNAFSASGTEITVGSPGGLGGSVATTTTMYGTTNLLGNVRVNGGSVMKTATPNIPAGQQPIELIASGAAATNASGEFTIMFPSGTFPNACQQIFIVPDSGGAVIPVVNGTGALTKTSCRAVQPGNGNKSITYSYRAIGY